MSDIAFGNKVFDSFTILLNYLEYFFDDDVSFALSNKDTFIMQKNNPNLPIKVTVGDKIPEGGGVQQALKTGKHVIKEVPKEVYGTPFTSYAIPVKNEKGEVEGCIVLAKSIARKVEVFEQIEQVASSLEQISTVINTLAYGVQELVNTNSGILSTIHEASAEADNTSIILGFIHDISTQTNLLGLNAAIEAARAGESGKGFKIVASEIRKLSASTNESVKKVEALLKNVTGSIKSVNEEVSKSNRVFEDEAAAFEEIAASVQELNLSMSNLKKLAKNM